MVLIPEFTLFSCIFFLFIAENTDAPTHTYIQEQQRETRIWNWIAHWKMEEKKISPWCIGIQQCRNSHYALRAMGKKCEGKECGQRSNDHKCHLWMWRVWDEKKRKTTNFTFHYNSIKAEVPSVSKPKFIESIHSIGLNSTKIKRVCTAPSLM